ncbi:MAG: NADH-ubiquinone oxidoreductase chain J, partial [uncultured Acidimicrobiales bacterium]
GGPEHRLRHPRRGHGGRRVPVGHHPERRAGRPVPGRCPGRSGRALHPPRRRVRGMGPGPRLHRRRRRAPAVRRHAHPGPDRAGGRPRQRPAPPRRTRRPVPARRPRRRAPRRLRRPEGGHHQHPAHRRGQRLPLRYLRDPVRSGFHPAAGRPGGCRRPGPEGL